MGFKVVVFYMRIQHRDANAIFAKAAGPNIHGSHIPDKIRMAINAVLFDFGDGNIGQHRILGIVKKVQVEI